MAVLPVNRMMSPYLSALLLPLIALASAVAPALALVPARAAVAAR
jgi:hypothetical protein